MNLIKKLPIDSIRRDGGTQARVGLNEDTVREYAELCGAGVELPPVIVIHDGTVYWLADGFHRAEGAKKAGLTEIHADIRPGTRRDAVLFAVGANETHGLRRTNADKRHAVNMLLADPEWAAWSDREIARRCSVSHSLVAEVRGLTGNSPSQRTYRTSHGTVSMMDVSGIGRGDRAAMEDAPATQCFITAEQDNGMSPVVGPLPAGNSMAGDGVPAGPSEQSVALQASKPATPSGTPTPREPEPPKTASLEAVATEPSPTHPVPKAEPVAPGRAAGATEPIPEDPIHYGRVTETMLMDLLSGAPAGASGWPMATVEAADETELSQRLELAVSKFGQRLLASDFSLIIIRNNRSDK